MTSITIDMIDVCVCVCVCIPVQLQMFAVFAPCIHVRQLGMPVVDREGLMTVMGAGQRGTKKYSSTVSRNTSLQANFPVIVGSALRRDDVWLQRPSPVTYHA